MGHTKYIKVKGDIVGDGLQEALKGGSGGGYDQNTCIEFSKSK